MRNKPAGIGFRLRFVRGCRQPHTVEQSLLDTVAWWMQYLFQKKSKETQ